MNHHQKKGTQVKRTTRSGGVVGVGGRAWTPRLGSSTRTATAASCAGLLFASLCTSQALLVGCGGTESTTSPASSLPLNTTSGSQATAESTSASSASPPKVSAVERRRAGRAAPFLNSGSDNSVPTFGAESSAAERRSAGSVIRTFLVARAAGDWSRACEQLAAANAEGLAKLGRPGRESCAQVLSALTADTTNSLAGRPLAALRVKGENAFALFFGREGHQYMVPLLREAGAWRLTQSTPIPYPPAAP